MLVGDYNFSHRPEAVSPLVGLSKVAAGCFCPFLSAASPGMFGFHSWDEIAKRRYLEPIFESDEHAGWRAFRASDESRLEAYLRPRLRFEELHAAMRLVTTVPFHPGPSP